MRMIESVLCANTGIVVWLFKKNLLISLKWIAWKKHSVIKQVLKERHYKEDVAILKGTIKFI